MKKQFYIPPRINVYKVETTAILAGSGESQNHVSISVNGDVKSGDEDDVWE